MKKECVSKLQNGSYQLHGRAYYFSMFDFSIRVYAKFLFSVNFVFRLLEEVYIEVFNERILTHTIRAQNVSKDTFCENAFKKECISKLQQCLYQSHRLNLKTKRNHSCIEFSLKQKWSLIFWISIYPEPSNYSTHPSQSKALTVNLAESQESLMML